MMKEAERRERKRKREEELAEHTGGFSSTKRPRNLTYSSDSDISLD
jgi:hypothetical protein